MDNSYQYLPNSQLKLRLVFIWFLFLHSNNKLVHIKNCKKWLFSKIKLEVWHCFYIKKISLMSDLIESAEFYLLHSFCCACYLKHINKKLTLHRFIVGKVGGGPHGPLKASQRPPAVLRLTKCLELLTWKNIKQENNVYPNRIWCKTWTVLQSQMGAVVLLNR